MSSSASLPLPVGAGVTAPASRSIVQAWAAPRAADLVLDPWAAPVGPPIAQYLLSPWPAPNPMLRIVAMPPPSALAELPDLSERTASLAASTDAAIEALHAATTRSAVVPPAPTAPTTVERDTPDAAVATASSPSSVGRLRARMWAMLAGGAVAVAGVVTLVATAF